MFGKLATKKITWENPSKRYRMKTKTNLPKYSFLWFFQKPKTIKIEELKPQTLLKTCFKHSRNQKFFSLKNLAKIPKRWGFYRPNQKLAIRAELAALTGSGRSARSTPNGQNYDRWATAVDRPGRPKQTESSALRPVDRPGRPSQSCQTCTDLCTSVDRPGRPTSA